MLLLTCLRGYNVKPEAYREVMQFKPQNLHGHNLKLRGASLLPTRSQVSPKADRDAKYEGTGQSYSVKAT